jgi:hypothetical protein
MYTIYVAGPYSSNWKLFKKINILINIFKARKVAKKLWKCGYTVVCPHSNTAFFDNISYEIFIEGYINILKKCDILIVLPNYKNSKGTIAEIITAKSNLIPQWYIKNINSFCKIEDCLIIKNIIKLINKND